MMFGLLVDDGLWTHRSQPLTWGTVSIELNPLGQMQYGEVIPTKLRVHLYFFLKPFIWIRIFT